MEYTSKSDPSFLRPYARSHATLPSTSPSQTPHVLTSPRAPSASLSSTARDFLPELDLDLNSSAGEAWQNTRSLFDALLYKYTSVLLAQPFDVAKIVLQVSLPASTSGDATPKRSRREGRRGGSAGGYSGRSSRASSRREAYEAFEVEEQDVSEEEDADDSDDVPDYFSSTAPRSRSPRKRRRTPLRERSSPSLRPGDRQEQEHGEDYRLHLKKGDSITNALSSLYNTSGAVGLWRGTNCTFLYTALLRTTDSFLRSMFLALLGLPDIIGPAPSGLGSALSVQGSMGLSGLDLSDSPSPLASLFVVALSSCLAGLLLSPLDQVRTKLTITPTTHAPRGLLQNLRRLPSLVAPSVLWVPTILAHTVPQTFSAAMPLLLRRQLKISPELTPNVWSVAAFGTCMTDLFLRLPLETLQRRAHIHTLRQSEPLLPTITEVAPYAGVVGTVYSILYSEGEVRTKDVKGMVRIRKGQGVAGLVRGWRVGFWGFVGVWGAGALGAGEGNGGSGEF